MLMYMVKAIKKKQRHPDIHEIISTIMRQRKQLVNQLLKSIDYQDKLN